jgi:hypothetical protein
MKSYAPHFKRSKAIMSPAIPQSKSHTNKTIPRTWMQPAVAACFCCLAIKSFGVNAAGLARTFND